MQTKSPIQVTRPKIALLGYGRSGKDSGGYWCGMHTPLVYTGSTSDVVNPLIAAARGITPEENWARRHQERMFWYEWCNEFRRDDPTKLARAAIDAGADIIVGMRDAAELNACKAARLFDLTIWVENPRVPPDPTVTFTRDDCDIVIDNNRRLGHFHGKLANLIAALGIEVEARYPVTTAADDDQPTLVERRWLTQQLEEACKAGLALPNWYRQLLEDYVTQTRAAGTTVTLL